MSTSRKRKWEVDSLPDSKPIEDVKIPEFLAKAPPPSRAYYHPSNFELEQKERSKEWSKVVPSSTWKVSEPIGGRLINGEPIFAGEEKYLILAYDGAIKVYSASTSLLVRTLPADPETPGEAIITACALSAANSNTLYISTTKNQIYHWNWVAGNQLGRWNVGRWNAKRVFGMAISALAIKDSTLDVVYTQEQKGDYWMIAAYSLGHGNDTADIERTELYKTRKPISGLHVTPSGENIVASYGEYLVVGATDNHGLSSFSKMEFVWRELWTPERITCLDVREIVTRQWSRKKGTKDQSKHLASQHSLDVVTGGLKGAIYVHENLLHKLIQKEREALPTASVNLTPLKLHWHREAVATVKWSLDGNYIISGGSETVLVLWQLDTGKTQFLPHLSSAIESLVVSPTGSSYAVRLADNSAMILSTTELLPKSHVAGIQTRCFRPALPSQVYVQTVDTLELERSKPIDPGFLRTPTAIHPLHPTRLLNAVPASQPGVAPSASYANASYLQTFDFSAGHHLSRQALTRTNATTINVGPEANKIGEPNVKFMQVSYDGQWLVTVDEWTPPQRDVDFLASSKSETTEKQDGHREVFLKFWAWDAERQEWELSTRIDEPHPARDGYGGTSKILSLAAAPENSNFATLGEDGDVRIWSSKARLRDGVVVRGTKNKGLVTWSCRYSILLASNHHGDGFASSSQRGFLAYSTDGSVLVAALQKRVEDPGILHFIDPMVGKVQDSQTGLYSGDLVALNLVGRYLILVSTTIAVWDIVLGELLYGLSLQPSKLTVEQTATMTHLAVDHISQTFAISLPFVDLVKLHIAPFHEVRKYGSAIAVFTPSDPKPLYSKLLGHVVTSLIPIVGSKGYLALNSACELSILTPITSSFVFTNGAFTGSSAPSIEALPTHDLFKEDDDRLENIALEEDDGQAPNQTDEAVKHLLSPRSSPLPPEPVEYGPPDHDDDEFPIVRRQQLADIFDIGPAVAMPPMGDLFEQVAGLFSKKVVAA